MRGLIAALVAVSIACNTGGERVALDEQVGTDSAPPVAVRAQDGLAQVRGLSGEEARLWAQAPELIIEIDNSGDEIEEFDLIIDNAFAGAEFAATVDGMVIVGQTEVDRPRPTERQLRLTLAANATTRVAFTAPPVLGNRYRVVVMGDIQTALDRVDEVFDAINQQGDIEFVISTGDIVETGKVEEYDLFDQQLERLDVPFYSTIGNHELLGDIDTWHQRYGRFSVYFVHRGVAFSFVDSGNATLHPDATARLQQALDDNRERLHLIGTHYPPFDPVGGRSGSFRSRKEASAFLARLADGGVDVTFYGHIHSYYAYTNAGIPAFISGGGGALPERWDGIGRHFLVVTVDGDLQSAEVALINVD